MGETLKSLIVTAVMGVVYYFVTMPFNLSDFVRYALGFSFSLIVFSLSYELFRIMSRRREKRLRT